MGFSKSPKRCKWYLCFKPQVEDYPFKPIFCLRKEGKETMLPPHNLLINFSADHDKLDSSSDGEVQPNKKSESRRRFSRAFKALLFQSSLTKKKRSRKLGEETSDKSSSSKLSSKLDKLFSSFRDKKRSLWCKESSDESLRTDSSRSSLFSSSTPATSSSSLSSSSSIASNSRSASERKGSFDLKQLNQKPTIYPKKTKECYINANVGLYFLLICLVGLVFGGKAFAIFCTSTSLFLIPCRFKRVDDQYSVVVNNTSVDSMDIDSDEYKKKVIMGGLLERSRTTRFQ
ncbi:hypothetical protein ACH5RR_028005 [Cinchona calisaya]|uniref:Uncharacterized protein n=1 Tax=Cinchona calisaya TaxID=153742 RepID=A0ABD2YMI1_9GENT